MTSRSIPAIDPGGVARRLGGDGEGIVIAVVGTGIDGGHPHFARHQNLVLPPPLQHYDLTLLRDRDDPFSVAFLAGEDRSDDAMIAHLSTLDSDVLRQEALIDRHGHSTHVAGIIAGYLEAKDAGPEGWVDEPFMAGVAAKCKLLSLKVIDDEGMGNELDGLFALNLVLALNAQAGRVAVHGAIIPLSFEQDVVNYAGGRTPLCDAVDRLVNSGVVVVAPTGNRGWMRVDAGKQPKELGALMSITDPGNAERAITVGATHRFRAEEYGASYFSGRGPTLDGRSKPDLLAPGEKITSALPAAVTLPGKGYAKGKRKPRTQPAAEYGLRDGTEMAAAHVAGAVAVLLSTRPELVGRPAMVKELLLSTATDLGRHAHFQGRGLLNLSRALGDDARTEPPSATAKMAPQVAPHAPAQIVLPDAQQGPPAAPRKGGKRFAVALSFPGDRREYVKRVYFAIRDGSDLNRSDIFYDKFYESELGRPDLDVYLLDIYGKQSELVVVFLSADYETKEWCGLEWRAVRELIKTKEGHAVMPVRFDDTHIPGLLSLDGYISAKNRDPEHIADLIIERLQTNRSLGLL